MIKETSINTIRLAGMREASTISDLLYRSFIEYKSLYTDKAFAATTPDSHEIENRIYKNVVWVALYNGVITGTISIVPNGEGMLIRSVAVSPAARGNGLGRELMKYAEKMAEESEAKYLELTTTPFLFEAIRLYEFFEFKQCGYEDLYGTLLIKMKKFLKSTPVSLS